MTNEVRPLSLTFRQFFDSERAGGIVLLATTVIALLIANSPLGSAYQYFWQTGVGGLSLEHWVNDGLMAIFFLLIGLELERELYVGELSGLRNALLPIAAAIGGMLAPAAIHYFFNAGTATQSGFGIPMATDIAFALAILAILGNRVPSALKVFVVAFAVMDDLGAIIVIGIFYTATLTIGYLLAAAVVWISLLGLNRLRVMSLIPYLLGGAVLWFLMLHSGVHATLAGVLLAFAIPFDRKDNLRSPSHRVEHAIHKPVALLIMPIFALANTGVVLSSDWLADLGASNSLGIILGLTLGKPLGVLLGCAALVLFGVSRLPQHVSWWHLAGAGALGGVGFTMAIFISSLAFAGDARAIVSSTIAILVASAIGGTTGYIALRVCPMAPLRRNF